MATTAPSAHLLSILVTKSVCTAGGSSGWCGYLGRLLDKPDTMVLLNDTPGQNPNPKFLLEYPIVTAVVRGSKEDYQSGYNKGVAVKDALLGIDPQVMSGGDRIDGITMMSDLALLKWDENARPLFSLNFRLIFEPTTNALTSRESL